MPKAADRERLYLGDHFAPWLHGRPALSVRPLRWSSASSGSPHVSAVSASPAAKALEVSRSVGSQSHTFGQPHAECPHAKIDSAADAGSPQAGRVEIVTDHRGVAVAPTTTERRERGVWSRATEGYVSKGPLPIRGQRTGEPDPHLKHGFTGRTINDGDRATSENQPSRGRACACRANRPKPRTDGRITRRSLAAGDERRRQSACKRHEMSSEAETHAAHPAIT